MGNNNSLLITAGSDPQYEGSPKRHLNNLIQRQSEFEHWKQLGNEMAVSALQNSDRLSWFELEQRLKKALEFYDKTPSFKQIYKTYEAQKNKDKKLDMSIVQILQGQSYNDFNYSEELMRVSKNKSVCLRALIQNIYIQMQINFEKKPWNYIDDQEIVSQLIFQFVENQNWSLRFVVDQLGVDTLTGRVGVRRPTKTSQTDLPVAPFSNERLRNMSHLEVNEPIIPGPGGSPATLQPPSFQISNVSNSIKNGSNHATPTRMGKTPSLPKARAPMSPPVTSNSKQMSLQKPINKDSVKEIDELSLEKRFIEILQSSQFLFQDNFLKNLLQPEQNLAKKIYFMEIMMGRLSPYSYDFTRKICWIISKQYYQKSVLSQNTQNIHAAMREIKHAKEYYQRYITLTTRMQNNPILKRAQFLDNCTFLTEKKQKDHQIRIENHLEILTYQQNLLNSQKPSTLKLKSPQKQKIIKNMQQQASQINSDGPNNPVINKQGMMFNKAPSVPVLLKKGELAPFSRPKIHKNKQKPDAFSDVDSVTSVGLDSNSRNIVYAKSAKASHKQIQQSNDTTAVPGPFKEDSRTFPLHAVQDPNKNADDSLGSYVENCWTESLTSMRMREQQASPPIVKQDTQVSEERKESQVTEVSAGESTPSPPKHEVLTPIKEKIITKIEVKKQVLIPEPQSAILAFAQQVNDQPVNLEVKNSTVPYYLKDDSIGSKKLNRSAHFKGNQGSKRRGQLSPQPGEKVKLQKVLKQKPQSYQQKMIQQRIKDRIKAQHDDSVKKYIHEIENGRTSRQRRRGEHTNSNSDQIPPQFQTLKPSAPKKKVSKRKTDKMFSPKYSQGSVKSLYSFSNILSPKIQASQPIDVKSQDDKKSQQFLTIQNATYQASLSSSPKKRNQSPLLQSQNGDKQPAKETKIKRKAYRPVSRSSKVLEPLRVSKKPSSKSPMDIKRPPSQRTPLTPSSAQSRGNSSNRGASKKPVSRMGENIKKLRKLRSSELTKGLPGYMHPLMSRIPGDKSKKVIKQRKGVVSPKGTAATPRDQQIAQMSRQDFRVHAKNQYETHRMVQERKIKQIIAEEVKLDKENAKKAAGKKVEKTERELMPADTLKTPRAAGGVHRLPKKMIMKDSLPAVVVQKKPTNKIVNKPAIPSNKSSLLGSNKKVLIKKQNFEPLIENEKVPEIVTEKDFLPLRRLGSGSFGDVYLVREKRTGKLYAMKTLNKQNELKDSWLRYVKTERDVLAETDNPFIVKLHYAFQTQRKLLLVIDFCPGGDLATMLSQSTEAFSEEKARFYIAEIVLALKELHQKNIIYRDLKPDNVVIDDEGHAALIDFGMAKDHVNEVEKGAKTFCGSVKYLAPEMLKKIGHGQSLDWYLLGVLLYEMLVGVTPYFSYDKDILFDNIIYGKLKLPTNISAEVKNLIICLLNRNPVKRLGSKPGDEGAQQIMSHPFFNAINWDDLYQRRKTGNFAPNRPKYTMADFQKLTRTTKYTNSQIDQIYNGSLENEEDNTNEDNKGKPQYCYVDGWEYNRAYIQQQRDAVTNQQHPTDRSESKTDQEEEKQPEEGDVGGMPDSSQAIQQEEDKQTDEDEVPVVRLKNEEAKTPIKSSSKEFQSPQAVQVQSTNSKNNDIQKTPNFTLINNNFDMFQSKNQEWTSAKKETVNSVAGGMAPPLEMDTLSQKTPTQQKQQKKEQETTHPEDGATTVV